MQTSLWIAAVALLASLRVVDSQVACAEAEEFDIYEGFSTPPSLEDIDAAIAEAAKAGQYRDCAAETLYYKHDASVYGGYAGCTGEMGFLPCEQE
eukprot:2658226-Amphidinium_carterae.1